MDDIFFCEVKVAFDDLFHEINGFLFFESFFDEFTEIGLA